MADPRKNKKLYMKIFGDTDLYNEFLSYYDEAVARGSPVPEEMAWIEFRDKYLETDDGKWMPI